MSIFWLLASSCMQKICQIIYGLQLSYHICGMQKLYQFQIGTDIAITKSLPTHTGIKSAYAQTIPNKTGTDIAIAWDIPKAIGTESAIAESIPNKIGTVCANTIFMPNLN